MYIQIVWKVYCENNPKIYCVFGYMFRDVNMWFGFISVVTQPTRSLIVIIKITVNMVNDSHRKCWNVKAVTVKNNNVWMVFLSHELQ